MDYDQMTGYMNTHKFISHVNEQMNYWNRLHLIYLTISNISDVSNTLGFGVYETLLHQISQKVRLILDPEHYDIGIIKGDDIVILSNNSSTDIEKDMSQIVTMFESPPFYTDYFTFRLFAKIGIASYPYDDKTPELLIKKKPVSLPLPHWIHPKANIPSSQK